jgi:hypothetical protein
LPAAAMDLYSRGGTDAVKEGGYFFTPEGWLHYLSDEADAYPREAQAIADLVAGVAFLERVGP